MVCDTRKVSVPTTGGIYLKTPDGLAELTQAAYESEQLLQELLAEYPKLLAGEQIDSATPRRWVLVRRESSVPDSATGGARWSLDHLFLDQDGVPTLVEAKRSTDTRIRREVVGQMLDYAANAVAYWPVEKLISEFEDTCAAMGVGAVEALTDLLDDETTVESYWQLVKTNLQAGRIRMIFVADVIPTELQRIVEFLNEQFDPAEVFAVEVRQFTGEAGTALVPRLIGATVESKRRKGTSASGSFQRWKEPDFLAFVSSADPRAGDALDVILDWARALRLVTRWGAASMQIKLDHNNMTYNMFNVYANGRLELPFRSLKPPFDQPTAREELLARLDEALGGDVIPKDHASRLPQISLEPLLKPGRLDSFLAVWGEFVDEVRAWHRDTGPDESADGH